MAFCLIPGIFEEEVLPSSSLPDGEANGEARLNSPLSAGESGREWITIGEPREKVSSEEDP
jgi:hypothetical protein